MIIMRTAFCGDYPNRNHSNCPSSVECLHAVVYKGYGREDTSNPDEVVFHDPTHGGWYIEMGFAGFNSPTNNCRGYASRDRALAAVVRYQNKKA